MITKQNSNGYHFIFNHRKVQANERIVIKITPKEDMTVKFLIRTDGLKSVMYDFDFKENVRNILNEPSIYRVYEINQTTISQLDSKKNYLIYDKDIDGLEFYARDKNNFVQIDKGSVLTINPKELSTKYQKYDKFLLLMGKNDCGEKYCNDFSNYQLKHFETLFYTSVKEFKDQQRIPINIKSCRESLWYYVVFNYGKQLATQDYSDSVLKSASKMTMSSMLSEGIEETSEELLLDLSKTLFNAANALRGDETRFDDAWKDMATRYGMSFIGGTVGGGIATALPGYRAARSGREVKDSDAYKQLVHLVSNGQAQEFIETVNKMDLGNRDLSTRME